jgi:serine/threonine-protein kinase
LAAPGQVFGRYEILRPLATGGMGEVLLARQTGIGGVDRLVVIKTVLPHLARDAEFLQRFLDETRVSSSLAHGNIVQVYEAGELDGEYFMAMEYVEGMDLKECLSQLRAAGERMPQHLALFVLAEVAKGLAYAHERCDADGRSLGIVHRDVSPANLLLSADGQVKLTDFGVAKAAARLTLSLPGTLHGKVYYMSPEQVSGNPVDARSDVFSLGIVAYEMLAGSRPFEGESEVAVIDSVRRCTPRPLRDAAPWIAPSMAALVGRALERDPDDRYPTMHAFETALTTYLLESHTVVSARALSDFLRTLSRPRAILPAPGSPAGARLEHLAAALPGGAPDGSPRTRTVQAPSAPVIPPPVRHGWTVGLVVTLVLASAVIVSLVSAGLTEPSGGPPDEPVAGSVPAGPDAGPAADAVTGALPGAAPPAAAPLAAPAVAPAAIRAAAAEPEPRASDRTVAHIRSVPRGAQVFKGDTRLGTTPIEVALPRSDKVRLDLRLDGYEERSLTLSPDSGPSHVVTLPRVATGKVRFRFFPADAALTIDGVAVHATGNLVTRDLAEGEHVLRLVDGDRQKSRTFVVKALETTELGTVDLPHQD